MRLSVCSDNWSLASVFKVLYLTSNSNHDTR